MPELPPIAAPGEAATALGEREFQLACRLIGDYAGIRLSPHKRFMVYNRLLRRLRALDMDSFGDYLALVQQQGSAEREAFVNALTTNLTAFFREPHHFELLLARAQAHAASERRPLRVWSSACSTGEEAWSIAMVLREAGCPGEIVASDIDTDALQVGSDAVYPMDRAAALPPARLKAHLLRGTGSNEGWVSIRPELRGMVRFVQINLQSPTWPQMERFDVIFCRNVVIYFDREAQKRLLAQFVHVLRPGGLLMVGHSESFPATHPGFRSCGRTAYERRT